MDIKKSVEIARVRAGISKGKLAEIMGISPQSLSGIMSRNRPSGEVLQSLADALNMKVSELIALGE